MKYARVPADTPAPEICSQALQVKPKRNLNVSYRLNQGIWTLHDEQLVVRCWSLNISKALVNTLELLSNELFHVGENSELTT
jgi:hypothetical protein